VSTAVSSWLPPGGPPFSPLGLSPALWLDASDATTITSSGSPAKVSQWNDKSGNGYNVAQGTGAAQPTTGANTRNGLNVLDFDGGDCLNYSGTTGVNVGAVTVYVVAVQTSNVNFAGLLSVHASTGDDFGSANSLSINTGGATQISSSQRFVVDASSGVSGSGATPYGVYTAVFRTDGSVDSFQNGAIGTPFTSSGSFGIANGGFLVGGRFLSGAINASFRVTGQIAEVLVFAESQTTTVRETVETYLKAKWGTP